jgi:transcriptional regulator with XRE-family HTH domain
MPERPHKVTPESARLGRELRALRTLVKLSQQDVADTLEVSKSTVQRVESGEQRPSRGQVRKWAEVTKASDEVTRRVIAMAEAMHGATWSDALAAEPVQHLQGVAARRDEEARLIRVWTPLIVPGLLNTAAYAREVIREMDPTGEMDIAAAASARIERQQILYRGGRRFEFLVGEEALRWSPGPGVLPGQLDRLAALASLDGVDLAVVPAQRVGAAGWHPFVYREPADGRPAYVTLELIWSEAGTDDPAVVAQVRDVWTGLWDAALHGDEALAFIREVNR